MVEIVPGVNSRASSEAGPRVRSLMVYYGEELVGFWRAGDWREMMIHRGRLAVEGKDGEETGIATHAWTKYVLGKWEYQ